MAFDSLNFRVKEPLIKSGKNQADADRDVGGRATHGAVAEIIVFRFVQRIHALHPFGADAKNRSMRFFVAK